jgi:hypothetical protein
LTNNVYDYEDDDSKLGQYYPQDNNSNAKAQKQKKPKSKPPKDAVVMRNVAYANDKVYFDMKQTVWKSSVESKVDADEQQKQVDQLIARSTMYRYGAYSQ